MNWKGVRRQFPALANRTYLNTATYGQLSLRTQAAVTGHFAHRDECACEDFLTWFDQMDDLRGLLGQLIHCLAEDIAFVPTACSALSLFLGGVEWRPGDRIVTLTDEFPNHYYYANRLKARGAELVEVSEIDTLPAGTRAIAISTVNYTSGYRPDLTRIARAAREAGALLYLDGTQSLGAMRFDVREVRPDMFAVDSYKWMLAPNGASFFYISPELRRTLQPAAIGWRSDKGWRSVDDLHHGVPQFPDGAERYEGGMLNFPSLYGLAESVRTMLEIGPDRIEARVLELAALAAEVLERAGAEIRHRNSNIVAARFPNRDASALARRLGERKIVVAARHGNLRVSPHFYNDETDLAALAAGI